MDLSETWKAVDKENFKSVVDFYEQLHQSIGNKDEYKYIFIRYENKLKVLRSAACTKCPDKPDPQTKLRVLRHLVSSLNRFFQKHTFKFNGSTIK